MKESRLGRMSVTELGSLLERIWKSEPGLRPRSDMHDYQLTYPPAVLLQQAAFRRQPTNAGFRKAAMGAFKAAAYYFHFGFCQYRCRYCFHYELQVRKEPEQMRRYVDALALEMEHVAGLTEGLKSGLFFLGGGTPTALPAKLLERFLESLLLNFGPPPTRMSTVEAKPVTASNEKLDLLYQAGFRRINLGVQTLDPALYAHHHHGEELDVAIDAIHRARERGFEYINIDLMTGLEKQSPSSWERTLEAAESLVDAGAIDSLFIYPFHDDPRSRSYGKPLSLPSVFETILSDAQARARLGSKGWKELGARFYRSPRHVRRELLELAKTRINPAYGEVLYHGFGNSSFSIGDRATYLNHRKIEDYCDTVEKTGLGISHWTDLDNDQRAARDLSFDLLYSPVARVRSRQRKYGKESMDRHCRLLDRWIDLGLGEENRLFGTFSLTPLGKLVHQQLIPFHYLPADRPGFDEAMEQRKASGRRYRGY
jgi:oxygen-independent coproporphyrinogen III oxidase